MSNYQTTILGVASHGFTDPNSEPTNLERAQYDELSNALSWSGTLVLLRHLFGT